MLGVGTRHPGIPAAYRDSYIAARHLPIQAGVRSLSGKDFAGNTVNIAAAGAVDREFVYIC